MRKRAGNISRTVISKVPAILSADKPPQSLKIAVCIAKAMATSLRRCVCRQSSREDWFFFTAKQREKKYVTAFFSAGHGDLMVVRFISKQRWAAHIRPEGWNNWDKPASEKTAYFAEYNSKGAGANPAGRVNWAHQLTHSGSHGSLNRKIS